MMMARLFMFLVMAGLVNAGQNIKLIWDPSPDVDVTGGIVYYGNVSRNYQWKTNVIGTNATILNLLAGTNWFFTVTATNNSGLESDFSNEVQTFIPLTETNYPPTITSPAAVRMLEDTSTNISILVWDVETFPGNLTVTASSPSAFIFPPGAIVVSGTNHNRIVKLNPAPNSFGFTQVAIVASDGIQSVTNVIALTVLNIPEPVFRLQFVSNIQVSSSPNGPWTNVVTTILPVDVTGDTGKFYRTWNQLNP